ncbi:hypothetical protein [Candidatus Ichthyocystis hellenicum]|uniref:hypothetical protein n=1 Tax=Candidatus Ichthyocystis hellenicum TaxID=1561003 RepID=UPI000B830478|nr:hypothetical protein [Candidatus Ichthyocystis hellenicum]
MIDCCWHDLYEKQCSDPHFLFPWYDDEYKRVMDVVRCNTVQVLLLSGLTLTGLFKLSYLVSSSLLCEKGTGSSYPCGVCVGCRWVMADTHPDLRCLLSRSSLLEFLPPSVNIGRTDSGDSDKSLSGISVDRVRDLSNFFSLSTHRGLRVVFIAPVESLTESASQALLKTLEEPLSKTIFVLMSYAPHLLKETLLSRCQVHFRVSAPRANFVESWLLKISSSSMSLLPPPIVPFIIHRPFYALIIIATGTYTILGKIHSLLFIRPFNFWETISSCKELIRAWSKFLTSHQAIMVLLDIIIVMLRSHISYYWSAESENLSLHEKSGGLLAWLGFFDQMQESYRMLCSASPNYELLLEHVMGYHPFLS